MKSKNYNYGTLLIFVLINLLVSSSVFAQIPEKISYQAIIRNSSNALITNTQIGMEINIRKGPLTGTIVYTETKTTTTNANGLVSIKIGDGAGFNEIDWSVGPYFIETKTDITGGTNYTITSTTQLLSVPYALYAKTAQTADASKTAETADAITGGIIETDPVFTAWDKNYNDLTNKPTLFDGNYSSLIGKPNLAPVATSGNYNDLNNKLSGTNNGDILYWKDNNWNVLPIGSNGQFLIVKNGYPTWVSTGELIGDKPTLTTTTATKILVHGAISGGDITSDGGQIVLERGVCWSTTPNPTILNSKSLSGNGSGVFTSNITSLNKNTTYYVRAFASNTIGTAYGNEVIFTTLDYGSFTDSRDNNVYQTVTIGSQTWMAENLKYLPSVVDTSTYSDTVPYYYVYGYYGTDVSEAKATTNYNTYGVLYNSMAAIGNASGSTTNPSGIQGSCPAGWHLPSDAEWKEFEMYIGMTTTEANKPSWRGVNEGGALKEIGTSHWDSPNTGATNITGFSALPSGAFENGVLDFTSLGNSSYFWTSSMYFSYTMYRLLTKSSAQICRITADSNSNAHSVRCVKD